MTEESHGRLGKQLENTLIKSWENRWSHYDLWERVCVCVCFEWLCYWCIEMTAVESYPRPKLWLSWCWLH